MQKRLTPFVNERLFCYCCNNKADLTYKIEGKDKRIGACKKHIPNLVLAIYIYLNSSTSLFHAFKEAKIFLTGQK